MRLYPCEDAFSIKRKEKRMNQTITEEINPGRQTDEDAELVRAAQQDSTRFEALYRRWLKPVYRYFYFRLGNIKDAEDLTEQVFLKAYQDLPRYRSHGAFSAWLFSIAHARLVDYYRKDSHKESQEIALEELEIPAPAADLPMQAIQKSEIEQVFTLLNGLSERSRR
jgi:RNA polymerase sigma-70 factor (ECF subfamily)